MTTETPERWRQVAALFDEAVKLAPERRGEYLVSACSGDADLHRRVVELLEASGRIDVSSCDSTSGKGYSVT